MSSILRSDSPAAATGNAGTGRRRVLIISPHFPPVNAPDMQRVRMSLPHYASNGWDPVVLAVLPDDGAAAREPELCATYPPSIRIVRANAKQWKIDPRKIGIIGFSAGGHLAARLTHATAAGMPPVDASSLAPELRQRVDQCMLELRRLNHEVRAYLQDLEPAQVNSQNFTRAVTDMLAAFQAEEGVQVEHRLDKEAVALIPPQQSAEIMNILREAVSNGLRHGHARRITLLAGRSDHEVALAVQDDGAGFKVSTGGSGHGLANMQARAAARPASLSSMSAF